VPAVHETQGLERMGMVTLLVGSELRHNYSYFNIFTHSKQCHVLNQIYLWWGQSPL